MGTPTSTGAGVKVGLPKKARMSQEWPWVSRETPWVFQEWSWMTQEWPWVSMWGGATIEASPRVSWGGEASDGASVWALPRESKDGEARGWASPWMSG